VSTRATTLVVMVGALVALALFVLGILQGPAV
jgi:uncharacterized membrane protein YqhA